VSFTFFISFGEIRFLDLIFLEFQELEMQINWKNMTDKVRNTTYYGGILYNNISKAKNIIVYKVP
jgi:hypothetical protein